jgi:hypothetical protein
MMATTTDTNLITNTTTTTDTNITTNITTNANTATAQQQREQRPKWMCAPKPQEKP